MNMNAVVQQSRLECFIRAGGIAYIFNKLDNIEIIVQVPRKGRGTSTAVIVVQDV